MKLPLLFAVVVLALTGTRLEALAQPLDTTESADGPPVIRPDPLREATLSEELRQFAAEPLTTPTAETEAALMESLAPTFRSMEGIPAETVERGAYKFRRSRIRLTEQERQTTKQPFNWLADWKQHPELYAGQPFPLHGYLTALREVASTESANEDGESPRGYVGQLQLWDAEAQTVRFLADSLPADLPKTGGQHEPLTIIGYVFQTTSETAQTPEPLLVTRRVIWHRPRLDAGTLDQVVDRTVGIREEESEGYYRTLLHAKLVDARKQKQLAAEFWQERQQALKRPRPLFVDLFKTMKDDPQIYRGQLVTLTGTLRKLVSWEADPLNDYGLKTLYEGWLFAEDSQENPTVVVFTENPDNLPPGEKLNLHVKVTGYVFKMYAYPAQGTYRVAPMLLAQQMEQAPTAASQEFPFLWLGGALGLLSLGVVLFLWWNYRKDRQFKEQRKSRVAETNLPPLNQ